MSRDDAGWQAWAEKEAANAAWQAKCHEMAGQIEREQMASERASQKAWQAKCQQMEKEILRDGRAENLALRIMQERRLETFTTDLLTSQLCDVCQRSKRSEWGSNEQFQHDTGAMKALLDLCDHLGITDPGADESQQLAREQQWQSSRSFYREATLCALEDEGSHIGTLMLTLCDMHPDWEPGDPAEDMVDALFALIDALPKSTTKQAGGAE